MPHLAVWKCSGKRNLTCRFNGLKEEKSLCSLVLRILTANLSAKHYKLTLTIFCPASLNWHSGRLEPINEGAVLS